VLQISFDHLLYKRLGFSDVTEAFEKLGVRELASQLDSRFFELLEHVLDSVKPEHCLSVRTKLDQALNANTLCKHPDSLMAWWDQDQCALS
jgi:hypothetical protein